MALIKDDQLVTDSYVHLDDDSALPADHDITVSLERWHSENDPLKAHSGALGIRLRSDQSPDLIADDLQHVSLITIDFPAFTDGRGFSYARALRERYGFDGEIRATGHLIRDQYLFLVRCGFNAIEIQGANDAQSTLAQWQAAMGEFSLFYQNTVDAHSPIMALRRQRAVAAQ